MKDRVASCIDETKKNFCNKIVSLYFSKMMFLVSIKDALIDFNFIGFVRVRYENCFSNWSK